MKKRMVATAFCFAMVSVFAMMGAVSAQADNSARHFDVTYMVSGNEYVIGKLTIDTNSGHYTVNVNWAKIDQFQKTAAKDEYRQTQYKYRFVLYNPETSETVDLGYISLTNNGGNIHGEGTLGPTVDLTTIARWHPGDGYAAISKAKPNT